MKEEALRSLGLTDKETRVYLANLRLGSSLVQKIAKTGILTPNIVYFQPRRTVSTSNPCSGKDGALCMESG